MNHRFEFRRVTDTNEILDVKECVVMGPSSEVAGSFLVGPASGWEICYIEVNEDIDEGDEGDVLVTIYMDQVKGEGFIMSTVTNNGRVIAEV